MLLSSSPTLIHNIISFQYGPNYSRSAPKGANESYKTTTTTTNIYTLQYTGLKHSRVNSIEGIVGLFPQSGWERKHDACRDSACAEQGETSTSKELGVGRAWENKQDIQEVHQRPQSAAPSTTVTGLVRFYIGVLHLAATFISERLTEMHRSLCLSEAYHHASSSSESSTNQAWSFICSSPVMFSGLQWIQSRSC